MFLEGLNDTYPSEKKILEVVVVCKELPSFLIW